MTVGYRAWKVGADMESPVLASLIQTYVWAPGLNVASCRKVAIGSMTATSTSPVEPVHDAPAHGCQCGFWMLGTVQQALDKAKSQIPFRPYGMMAAGSAHALVVGAVRAWGTIIEHEQGSRAGKAQILGLLRPALYVPAMAQKLTESELASLVNRLGLLYDVPVYGDPEALAAVSW